jgi:hypothetical protein
MRLARVGHRPVLVVEDGIVDIARAGGGRFGGDPMAPFIDWRAFAEWAAGTEYAEEPLGDRLLRNPIPHILPDFFWRAINDQADPDAGIAPSASTAGASRAGSTHRRRPA